MGSIPILLTKRKSMSDLEKRALTPYRFILNMETIEARKQLLF